MRLAPAVSVVMIFRDAAKFIAEAVDSVQAQSFEGWELVLVDDGSCDGSTELALAFAQRDADRIRYVEHPGHASLGMSASRNAGLRLARGELIAFLDADDVWTPRKLEEQLAILREHPRAMMVFGRTKYWHGWTGSAQDAARDHVVRSFEREDILIRPPHLLLKTLLGGGGWPAPSMSSVLVRRHAIDAVGGFEDTFEGQGEDSVLMVKLLLRGYAYYSGACWDWYRQHGESSMARAREAGRIARGNRKFLEWTRAYFAAHAVRDPYLLESLHESLLLSDHPVAARVRPSYLRRKIVQRLRALVVQRLSPRGRHRMRSLAGALRGPWTWAVRTFRLRRLWRTRPVHAEFGCYYGTPVDRVYIDGFLRANAGDIEGTVLEVGDATYTKRFGAGRVTRSEVLHAVPGNPAATLVADLSNAPELGADRFDCVILTQTLQCIYDFRGALQTVYRILKPGGVLLATFPGVAHQISREERPYWGDYWRWTSMAAERVFAEVFPEANVQVEARGNVLVAIAFLHGLVVEELRPSDFAFDDPDYELSIAVRAVKP